MAFKARTVTASGAAGHDTTIDGTTFGPVERTHPGRLLEGREDLVDSDGERFGVPTPHQLASDGLEVSTLAGRPWPGSSGDRLAKGNDRSRMVELAAVGAWPCQVERDLQARWRRGRGA